MTVTETLAGAWRAASGLEPSDSMLEWPPDVFAFTEVLLERTEVYRFAVSPPAGWQWPPHPTDEWCAAVVAAGADLVAGAADSSGDRSVPMLVADSWAVLWSARHVALDAIADGEDRAVCEALLTLHAIADEACAGMGVAVDRLGPAGAAARGRARELMARTGSLARIGRPGLRVIPKVRTPDGGISLRSLSRYACVRGPGVGVSWHKSPAHRPGPNPRREGANIVLLPWPMRVRASDFRPREQSVERDERDPFGFFDFVPGESIDLDLLDSLLRAALDEVDVVDMVVLPEASVPAGAVADVEAVLSRHGVSLLVAGIRDDEPPAERFPSNWVHLGVDAGGSWWHHRQNKHHRWSLDESQILQYHLGAALRPRVRWWEAMDVPRRSVQFVEVGGGITIAAVVCEDLARLDAVADLLRNVGPTIVVNVLLDGPQLASRWTARYATILADDPGSAVLTLTALGMVERSRPPGLPASRVVALWKDPASGARELSLDPGAQGLLLSVSVRQSTRYSADGRWPSDSARSLRDVGVHQLRAGPYQASAAAAIGDLPASTTEPVLSAEELTILAGWAESFVEARAGDGPSAVDAVIRDSSAGASWRIDLGVEGHSPPLTATLAALARVAAGRDDSTSDDATHRLARRVFRSVAAR